MTSTIHSDKIMNSSGDQDSGLDLQTNDQVKIKTANTDRITVTDSAASMGDSFKLRLGAGNDLNIYHDGSNSYIEETGTGDTHIVSNTVRIRADQINLSNNANSLDGLVMDSSGRIRMSKQPSFSAGLSGGNVSSTDATFVFNSEFFDVGGGYNNSTGIFTAPIAGKYLFQTNLITHNTNAAAYLYWSYNYNGSYVAHAYGYQHTTDKHQLYNLSILQSMAASDTMKVVNRAGAWYGGATQHGRFEGYLLG